MITTLLQTMILTLRLLAHAPHVEPERAIANVLEAQRVASASVPVEVVLAIAYLESRYEPDATSYVLDGRRAGGRWPARSQAGKGPRFCGVMQTAAGHSWGKCLQMRELAAGYSAGAEILGRWIVVARGDLALALRGYGCGFAGLKNGCKRYDARVFAMARRFGMTSHRGAGT